ncbi:YciI family protein [Hyphomonas sp.]|uniref:YciI family protein n=1 Tax=Hyphomonas sp. TaxID=87 RepID=UPI0035284492
MAFFLMKLVPPRRTFPADATASELEAMDRHSDYIRHLIDTGSVFAAGPVMDPDGTWGVAIAEADDEADARVLCDHDPVIRAGLGFRWDILPMASLLAPVR